MARLMRSVSGIRGIVGDPLSPHLVLEYLNAYLQITGAKKIIIGRDTRPTGPLFERVVADGCIAAGVEPVILGVATTPTVEMMVPALKAGGGIIITASHNPIEWNALKFLDKKGMFLNEEQVKKLFEIVDSRDFKWVNYKKLSSMGKAPNGDGQHINETLKLPMVKPAAIKKKKFRVAYDGVNGAGYSIVPKLLKKLGCEVVPIYIEPTGIFPHNPEPTPRNLKELSALVKKKKCDIGFATDPDADRCAIIDENGVSIGEEYTLAFATELILSYNKGPVTINLSTSRMIEDIGAKHGVPVHRAKVGEINVSTMMLKNKSVIGGEGNGGVILPDLHYGRDGILAIALVLQLMAQSGKKVSELVKDIPKYHIEKQKFDIEGKSLDNILGHLLAKFKEVRPNHDDGLRFAWEKSWVHVRASNTEPVLRVIAEAPTAKGAKGLCKEVEEEINSAH